MNYLSLNNYQKAMQLALAMEQPGRLLSLFKSIQKQNQEDREDREEASVTGLLAVDQVILKLGGSDLVKLLKYARDWNTNAKTSGVAQQVIHAVVKIKSVEEIMDAFKDDLKEAAFAEGSLTSDRTTATALKDLVEGLIPYTERHLARINRLIHDSYMVDYILGEMDDGLFDQEMDVDTASTLSG